MTFPDNPTDIRSKDEQAEDDAELNPLHSYTLSQLTRLQAFVDEELERLFGAPFSSLNTDREENISDTGGESCDPESFKSDSE